RLSAKLLLQSKNFNKEIYILTDNQKTTLAGLTRAENRQPIQKLFDPNVRVFVVPLSEQTFENMGIVSVEVLPTLFQQGKPFTVRASIENYGTARVENHLVSLFLDGTRVMQKSLTLEGGGRTSVELTATPQHPGFFKGRVELEEDAFDEDNARYFSVDIPERINVLVSSSEPKSSAYLRLALSVHNEDETSTVLGFTEIPPQQLTYGALTKTDVVLLSNVASLSSTQADELNEFMSDGGGLIFFPGDRVNVAEYNSEVLSKLELPPLLPISPQTRSDVAVSFDKIDYDHPLFQGMFENVGGGKIQKREIESPKVYESSRFASEKNIRSIISLSDGTPFLWEKIGGTRRILGFAVAANTAWSDFPVKGIFVPLLYQTILYAASGRSSLGAFPSVTAGDRIAIPLSKLRTKEEATEPAASPTLRVLDPSGKESLVQPSTGGRMSSVVAFDNTEKPGVYVIAHGRDTLAEIPVNVDPAESEPARATKDEFLSLAEKMGIGKNAVTFVSNPGSIQSVVLQSRFGIELWKYFLLAALVVAVAEMIVAREPKE
ncbi:MAG TPA: CARDB domain-containing protein, partial [Bacteroidota bacterium]|nr:CARDB domain-containing protein [Bacteroidota bacterium]